LGVYFTYPGGKFNDALVHFFTALVGKQKTGINFMLGSWQGVKGSKKVEDP